MKMITFRCVIVALVSAAGIITSAAQSGCNAQKICLTVVSQRKLSKRETDSLSPGLRSTAVRLKLFNGSNNEIVYLTGLGSIEPVGFRMVRRPSSGEWEYAPVAKKRADSALIESGIGAANYLGLKPNSAIEFDLVDWGNPVRDTAETEHAYSIFMKMGGVAGSDSSVELISQPFHPSVP